MFSTTYHLSLKIVVKAHKILNKVANKNNLVLPTQKITLNLTEIIKINKYITNNYISLITKCVSFVA